MNHRILFAAALIVFASGCVTSHPQTADEFRKAVPGSFSAKVETFKVKRPYRRVSATFRKKAKKCLNVAIKTTSRTNMSYQQYTTTYKPTVIVKKNRTELHVQQHIDNTVKVTKEPKGGYYLFVADAYPVSKNTTQIDLYRPAMGYKILTKAVKGWASGKNMGCPDMTKI